MNGLPGDGRRRHASNLGLERCRQLPVILPLPGRGSHVLNQASTLTGPGAVNAIVVARLVT